MIRYPRLRSMMPNLPTNSIPKAPSMAAPNVGARAMMGPPPAAPMGGRAAFGAPPAAPMDRASLPSIQATANQATPIELGDPKRLGKIATILRMGRK